MRGPKKEGEVEVVRQNLTKEQKELARIFALSFQHSQGNDPIEPFSLADPSFQTLLFKWIVAGRYLPAVDIPQKMPEYVVPKVPEAHRKVNSVDIIDTSKNIWWLLVWAKGTEGNHEGGREKLIEDITFELIKHDLLRIETGRFGKDLFADPDSADNMYASFFRRYAILGKPAGHRAYNDMYGEVIKNYEANRQKNEHIKVRGKLLEMMWESRHGKSFWEK